MEEEHSADDNEHLSALSIGHFILAGVSLFSGIPILMWAVAMAAFVDELGADVATTLGDISGQVGVDALGSEGMLEELQTLIQVAIVAGMALAIVAAVHLIVVGVKIRQRRWWLFCYLTGWGECIMFPFGTILGIFTIIVLGRSSVKKLFGVN